GRTFEKQHTAWNTTPEGQLAASNVLSWQTDLGSWPKNLDTTKERFGGDRNTLKGTFDNGATVGELRFLAHAFNATKDPRFESAVLKGIDHILSAQYRNGG